MLVALSGETGRLLLYEDASMCEPTVSPLELVQNQAFRHGEREWCWSSVAVYFWAALVPTPLSDWSSPRILVG
eukprot:6175001-Pleurochrysis_carterae.AAC.2